MKNSSSRIDEISEETEREMIEQIDEALKLIEKAVKDSPDGKVETDVDLKGLGTIILDQNDLESTGELIFHQFLAEEMTEADELRERKRMN